MGSSSFADDEVIRTASGISLHATGGNGGAAQLA